MQPTASRTTQVVHILVGLIVVGGLCYWGLRHQPVRPTDDIPVNSQQPAEGWASEKIDEKVIDESGKTYRITAKYPVAQNSAVTAYFKTFVDDQVAAFKNDSLGEVPPEDSATQVYTLDVSYTTARSKNADNFVFQVAIDTGGAHGLQATHTFSFTQGGTLIGVGDLFTKGVEGLKTVAPYVKTELAKEKLTNQQWIDEGAAPTEENYQNFTIGDSSVTFIFDAYQVAAYAAGIQRVEVPLTVFKSIANPKVFSR